MIRSFGSRETLSVWRGESPASLPPDIIAPALKRLNLLGAATQLRTIAAIPGNHLERMKSIPGLWSIRINQQYRIVFWWRNGAAENVEIVNYKN